MTNFSSEEPGWKRRIKRFECLSPSFLLKIFWLKVWPSGDDHVDTIRKQTGSHANKHIRINR